MLSSSASPSPKTPQLDYFSLPLHQLAGVDSLVCSPELPLETPSDPTHPLLALRSPSLYHQYQYGVGINSSSSSSSAATITTTVMETSKLMQHQTMAAYASHHRPQPQPMQHLSSGTSSSSSSSGTDSTDSGTPSEAGSLDDSAAAAMHADAVRCSRCHRSLSSGVDPSKSGFVSFGTNLYYCSRCASLVGYVNR